VHRGRPITAGRVDRALTKVAHTAGIGHVTAHQPRHTLATQAINRGMSLDAMVEAMLRGWRARQKAREMRESTITLRSGW
jgi:integrase